MTAEQEAEIGRRIAEQAEKDMAAWLAGFDPNVIRDRVSRPDLGAYLTKGRQQAA